MRSDYPALVATNARRFRQERGFSLGELARRSGLSKQTLSKLEQGEGNPTVDTLAAVGSALDVSVPRLLTEWGSPIFVRRAADGEWLHGAEGEERFLDEIFGTGRVQNVLVRFERGGDSPAIETVLSPGTLHHLYLISGRLRTGPVGDSVDLGPGDYVRFPADLPYRHVCLSERALAHLVTTVPQIRQFDRREG